jgi:hypothetical protein
MRLVGSSFQTIEWKLGEMPREVPIPRTAESYASLSSYPPGRDCDHRRPPNFQLQSEGTKSQCSHSWRGALADRGSSLMAKPILLGPSVAISCDKRLVTIVLQLGNPEASMTITVEVPREESVYTFRSARVQDLARHFLELPCECPQRTTRSAR